jgi:hypothetical protein
MQYSVFSFLSCKDFWVPMNISRFNWFVLAIAASATVLSAQTIYVPNGTSGIGNNTSNSNVGIGTPSPGNSLEIYKLLPSNATLQPLLALNSDYGSAAGVGFGSSIVFRGRTAGNLMQDNAQIAAYNENGSDNGYALGFFTAPNASNAPLQRMTILRGGNVGIGTTNPISKLQLEKTANDTASLANSCFFFADTALGAGLLGQQKLSSPYSFVLQGQNQTNNAFFPISLNPSGGNVGIGTTTPRVPLEVYGSSVSGPVNTGTTPNSIFQVHANYNVTLDVGSINAPPYSVWMQVGDVTGYQYHYPLSLNPNGGNVGIGTTGPGYKLDVRDSSDAQIAAVETGSGNFNRIVLGANASEAYVQELYSLTAKPLTSGLTK